MVLFAAGIQRYMDEKEKEKKKKKKKNQQQTK
jgi:hypothetical protein